MENCKNIVSRNQNCICNCEISLIQYYLVDFNVFCKTWRKINVRKTNKNQLQTAVEITA
jgi:hypothetical protein